MARVTRTQAITAALKAHGPMTVVEIAEHLELDLRKTAAAISGARYYAPGQVFKIVRYQAITGRWGRDAAVFAAGKGRDVAHQPLTGDELAERKAQVHARYRDRHRAAINARSAVFKARVTGRAASDNPWLQLAAPSARSAVSRLTAAMP